MTKQEAAEILGIPVTATAEEVRRRYQEVFSDFQIRLTNAPTAQLRKTYQVSLRDFQLACEVLAPGVIADSGVEDLPTAQPSAPVVQPPRTTAQASRRPSHPPPVPEPGTSGGLPKSTIILSVILTVLVAAIASTVVNDRGKPTPVVGGQSVPPTVPASRAFLLIYADAPCRVEVNGEEKGQAGEGGPLKVGAELGQNVVKATSLDAEGAWQKIVEVKGFGQVVVNVELAKDIAERKQAEAQAVTAQKQAEEQAAAERKRAEEQAIAKRKQAEEQAAAAQKQAEEQAIAAQQLELARKQAEKQAIAARKQAQEQDVAAQQLESARQKDYWTDPSTGLMWAMKDNGSDVDWNAADRYCRAFRAGDYSDWRLPEIKDLEGLYDASREGNYKIKWPLTLTACCPWSSEKRDSSSAWSFTFGSGRRLWPDLGYATNRRALCVRRSGG